MIEVQGAGHGVGGLAGVPDVSYTNHLEDVLNFLETKAPSCLSE